MAMSEHEPVTEFAQWYQRYEPGGGSRGLLATRGNSRCADAMWRKFEYFRSEADMRLHNYYKLELLADGQVIRNKPDLANVSSGETAGLVRRLARSLVQNTPNVEVMSQFDDDSMAGIYSRFILTSKIIGSDQYSNDMQQNLFCTTKTALTLGFGCVIPALLKDAGGSWYVKYDTVHYRDVFPDPGVKDVRDADSVFVRRYLTKGDVKALIRGRAVGWDLDALELLLENDPPSRKRESTDLQTAKHHQIPRGYEIITWYSNSGDPFLTFEASTKMLLRIEKNKHPLKQHPVFFLVLEKDDQQPFGKSQVELVLGRQDFQDLMLNGAMKLWYRNINPSIIGYGTVNAAPNLGPGKYTEIANPNAKLEAFEVNTQTLLQYGAISQQNLGSMIGLVGAPDQQAASQGVYDTMSATPQGVEQQQQQIDITTNNYQKAIESFFSHYCSYALTIYFQELRALQTVVLNSDTKEKLLNLGLDEDLIKEDNTLTVPYKELATQYYVRCIPGSLVEMADEKQLRVLNQLFIPLSQALPALANAGDPQMLKQAAAAMSYIIGKQIELSGSASASEIQAIWNGEQGVEDRDQRLTEIERRLGMAAEENDLEMTLSSEAIVQLQQQLSILAENQRLMFEKLGVNTGSSEAEVNTSTRPQLQEAAPRGSVVPAQA